MASRTRLVTSMVARDRAEPHRASTPLELLFDLSFVVAVAQAAATLHHEVIEGHSGGGVLGYALVFFAIWWAWMNFTWFASSYDTDDVPYRLLTLLQMAGVLLLAAGVPAAIDDSDYRAVTLGYLVMRVGLVTQWLRASIEDPVELSVPVWAERASGTTWHPHHIAERYGLFVIILLGESVLAASNGVDAALDARSVNGPLVVVALSGLGLLFALRWLYFPAPS